MVSTTDAGTKQEPTHAQVQMRDAVSHPNGPGAILALIRSGRAITRTQIMQTTGLSRSTVALRLDALLADADQWAQDLTPTDALRHIGSAGTARRVRRREVRYAA